MREAVFGEGFGREGGCWEEREDGGALVAHVGVDALPAGLSGVFADAGDVVAGELWLWSGGRRRGV